MTDPHGPEQERGAVLVLVALSMVALMGMAALVVDVGALHQERRQLQNGADAAALAVAQECAVGAAGCDPGTVGGVAEDLAGANARDGLAGVDEVCGDGPGLDACADPPTLYGSTADAVGWAAVTTSTQTDGPDGDQVSFTFAPVLGAVSDGDFDGQTVRARAAAAWGSPSATVTAPIAVARCELDHYLNANGGVLQQVVDGLLGGGQPIAKHRQPNWFLDLFPGAGPQPPCPPASAGSARGGFSWLQAGPGCEVASSIGDRVRLQENRPFCFSPSAMTERAVVVAVFDQIDRLDEPDASARVVGYAALEVEQWWLGWLGVDQCNVRFGLVFYQCVDAHFRNHVVAGSDFGGPDLGLSIVQLIG